jgi:SHAQKYF class myb-like DNA-binding protein
MMDYLKAHLNLLLLYNCEFASANLMSSRYDEAVAATGRWTAAEHETFLQGLDRYGRDWAAIKEGLPNRTVVQVRTHAQKYFLRASKEATTTTTKMTMTTTRAQPAVSSSDGKRAEATSSEPEAAVDGAAGYAAEASESDDGEVGEGGEGATVGGLAAPAAGGSDAVAPSHDTEKRPATVPDSGAAGNRSASFEGLSLVRVKARRGSRSQSISSLSDLQLGVVDGDEVDANSSCAADSGLDDSLDVDLDRLAVHSPSMPSSPMRRGLTGAPSSPSPNRGPPSPLLTGRKRLGSGGFPASKPTAGTGINAAPPVLSGGFSLGLPQIDEMTRSNSFSNGLSSLLAVTQPTNDLMPVLAHEGNNLDLELLPPVGLPPIPSPPSAEALREGSPLSFPSSTLETNFPE